MKICRRMRAFAGALALAGASVALAQTTTPVVGFNSNNGTRPINDPATSQEMFRSPQTSGSTAAYIVANTSGFDNNASFRASGSVSEGDAAMKIIFRWVNPADVDSWCRVTTIGGSTFPDPALNTAGKVRFKLINTSEFFAGNVGVVLGIRETGVDVPQLGPGGTAGEIEWVGVDTTANAIIAGVNGLVDTNAAGDDVQVFPFGTDVSAEPAGTAVILPGTNGMIDTVPGGDDQLRRGYTLDATGNPRPIPDPDLFLFPDGTPYMLEFDLPTGQVTLNGVNVGGGLAPFTGNGQMDVTPSRGVLEHIAFVNDAGDTAITIDVAIDELQFVSPTTYSVVGPELASPLIAGDTMVTVTTPFEQVDQVQILRDGSPILTQPVTPAQYTYSLMLPAAAMTDEVYTARVRNMGQFSADSNAVTVFPEPAPYTFSFLLDEDGNGCLFDPPGGWELVGASARINGPGIFIHPVGRPLFPNSAVWQTLDFRYDKEDVTAWLGGNGTVDPSPTGLYAMDSIWIKRETGAPDGPYEMLIDAIQVVDDLGNVVQTIDDFEGGDLRLHETRGQSSSVDTLVEQTTDASYSGVLCNRLVWTFDAMGGTEASLGQLTRTAFSACSTSYQWDATVGTTIRFHVVVRGPAPNAQPVPLVQSPVSSSQTSVMVTADAAATSVQLYINGVAVGAPVAPVAGVATFGGLTLNVGDSISATQVIAAETSDFAYPVAVQDIVPAPPTPILPAPIEAGDTAVEVDNLIGPIDEVEILDAMDMVIGSTMTISGGSATVPLIRPLEARELIRARAVNAGGPSDPTGNFEVGNGNGPLLLCLGVRETGQNTAALGSIGGTSGAIEWIGASGTLGGAPQGKPVELSDSWQTLIFDPATDPILSFSGGNNALTGQRGPLEHLAVTVNAASPDRSTGTYELYIDNIVNVGADVGGADFLLSNFDGFAVGDEALFQPPNFSGSTAGNLRAPPSTSAVSDLEGNGGQSAELTFFFVDTGENRWIRVTTSGADNLSRPIVSFLHPIRMDVLLRPGAPVDPCAGTICADSNCDGNVTVSDIAFFVTSITGGEAGWNALFPGGVAPCDYVCANDTSGDGNVTVSDIAFFVQAITGGGCQ